MMSHPLPLLLLFLTVFVFCSFGLYLGSSCFPMLCYEAGCGFYPSGRVNCTFGRDLVDDDGARHENKKRGKKGPSPEGLAAFGT